METLTIDTSSKSYPLSIGVGLRHELKSIINSLDLRVSSILILTDSNVAPLYLKDVELALNGVADTYHFVVSAGEKAKSFEKYYEIQTFALEKELDRQSLVIALGGGVVGDLAGFVAATYMRGVPFIQVPTTLLAHDSSVGGKVAINHPLGKNMIGAFYQPEAVIYDTEILNSLPESEWRSGFAEVIKHALIWDKSFYQWLRFEVKQLSDLRGDKLTYALRKGISVKAAVVSEDEKEKGIRAFLNFGHTLGHAIEAYYNYTRISHGDAVAIGMLFAIKVSEDYYNKDFGLNDLKSWFDSYGYPDFPTEIPATELLRLMKKDKKSEAGNIRMVLLKEIGEVETVTLEDQYVLQLLNQEGKD